jgi:hypothetical protein
MKNRQAVAALALVARLTEAGVWVTISTTKTIHIQTPPKHIVIGAYGRVHSIRHAGVLYNTITTPCGINIKWH